MEKSRAVFVGAFPAKNDPRVMGGQLQACKSLLASPLKDCFDWTLIDTTMETVPPPPVHRRLLPAMLRFLRFCRAVADRRVRVVLIFVADGPSFIEKGAMAVVAHWFGRGVVLAPRSGISIDDARRSWFMRWVMRQVLRRCDRVVCQGTGWRLLYRALGGLSEERVVVVRNCIAVGPEIPTAGRGGVGGRLVILFLGWIDKNKGIFDLIEAVRRFRAELGMIRVVVCGDGRDQARAKDEVERSGLSDVFEFRGWVTGEAKAAVLRIADVFVLPSRREGFPNSLLEAMGMGCAIVASEVGGVPELVLDGVSGLLVRVGDVSGLGRALLRVSRDAGLRQKLGLAAYQQVRRHHDIDLAWGKMKLALDGAVVAAGG